MRIAGLACVALALAACHEIPQDAAKPFAAQQDVKLYTGAPFNGDKAKFEQALAERDSRSNEYLRTHDAKQ